MALRQEALRWLEQAKADLRHAHNSFAVGDYNWCCFAAQQGAEKALKSLGIAKSRRRPPRGHDLVMLYSGVSKIVRLPKEVVDGLSELSAFYTLARYPNAGLERPSREVNRAQAQRAMKVAEGVLESAKASFELSRKD